MLLTLHKSEHLNALRRGGGPGLCGATSSLLQQPRMARPSSPGPLGAAIFPRPLGMSSVRLGMRSAKASTRDKGDSAERKLLQWRLPLGFWRWWRLLRPRETEPRACISVGLSSAVVVVAVSVATAFAGRWFHPLPTGPFPVGPAPPITGLTGSRVRLATRGCENDANTSQSVP